MNAVEGLLRSIREQTGSYIRPGRCLRRSSLVEEKDDAGLVSRYLAVGRSPETGTDAVLIDLVIETRDAKRLRSFMG